jgi:hypothetical protein
MDLSFASVLFSDVTKEWSLEMTMHCVIVFAVNPELLVQGEIQNDVVDQVTELMKSFDVATMAERLQLGRALLAQRGRH